MIIIISAIIGILILIIINELKPYTIKTETLNLINGGVKTGKSTLAIYLAIKYHKAILLNIRFKNLIRKLFKKELKKIPLLYSNIPLNYKYYEPLTTDILERKIIPIEKSILYIGEFSLVADSMAFKDTLLNEKTTLFFKLAGHSFNGKIFIDTQNINDCHHSLKKCITRYIFIHHSNKHIPLLINMKLCEMAYSYGNENIQNQFNGNLEDKMLNFYIPKKIWKVFDYRCYKSFDNGKKEQEQTYKHNKKEKNKDLKVKKLPTFMEFKTINIDKDKGAIKNETRNETKIFN